MTFCRLLESDQCPAKGTLTASALADNTKGLTFHDLKGYIINGFDCLAPFLAFKINFDLTWSAFTSTSLSFAAIS